MVSPLIYINLVDYSKFIEAPTSFCYFNFVSKGKAHRWTNFNFYTELINLKKYLGLGKVHISLSSMPVRVSIFVISKIC